MSKVRTTIAKRLKKTKPRGGKKPKVTYIKAGGKHLLSTKSPVRRRRLSDKKRTMQNSVVKKYKNVI